MVSTECRWLWIRGRQAAGAPACRWHRQSKVCAACQHGDALGPRDITTMVRRRVSRGTLQGGHSARRASPGTWIPGFSAIHAG